MRMSLEEIFLHLTTEEAAPAAAAARRRPSELRRRLSMSNILAIAHREIKAYFGSPIAYIVIGFFALMFGYFYYALLVFFDQNSMRMAGMGGPQTANINEQMIRPVFLNSSVILLFVLPLITMRTYSEEKRSGTMELLLTSPLTDFQIIMGKFLGAMTLYAAMLGVTLVHMGVLFAFGNPEWRPVVTGYLGMLLMGGCFIAVGLLDLEHDQEPDRRRDGHVRGLPDVVGHQLDRVVHRPDDAGGAQLPVDHRDTSTTSPTACSTPVISSTT